MNLKEQLEKECPELYQAYNISLNIATSEWLPSVGVGGDSYNSLPHIKNLENLLDKILTKCEKENIKIRLSAVEIYVLLSAVLFHDLGKSTWLSKDKSKAHGTISKEKIYNNARTFGIPNNELAKTIGNICRYHTMEIEDRKSERYKMSISEIDPYGEVNELLLATLLTFADYLDGTYTRAIPDYIAESSKIGIVGAFRSLNRGVNVDLKAQMVYTNLGDVESWGRKEDLETEYLYSYNGDCNEIIINDCNRKKFIESINEIIKKKEENSVIKSPEECKRMTIAEVKTLIENNREMVDKILNKNLRDRKKEREIVIIQNHTKIDKVRETIIKSEKEIEVEKRREIILIKSEKEIEVEKRREIITGSEIETETIEIEIEKEIEKEVEIIIDRGDQIPLLEKINYNIDLEKNYNELPKHIKSTFEDIDWLVVLQVFRTDRRKEKEEKGWKLEILLQTLMANIMENALALNSIKEELSIYGLPINAWLINYKDHLYNFLGQETFEPIFNKKMLKNVAHSMWFLSSRTFGSSYIDYEDLAAHLREPDIRKVMMAVRRLSIITSDKNGLSYIIYQANHWKWGFDSSKACRIMHLSDVEDIIEKLGDCIYEFK